MKDGLLTDAITGKLNDELENIATMLEGLPPDSQDWKARLKAHFDGIVAEAAQNAPSSPAWDFSAEKGLDSLASDDRLLIRPFREADIDFYSDVRGQWSVISQRMLALPEVGKSFFLKECQEDYVFYCMIESLPEHALIGYIALKDTRRAPWEIAIELAEDACGHGYGPHAIRLFLRAIKELTGHGEFQACVEADNIISQKCMDRAGARLIGLRADVVLKTDEERARFEEQNLDKIDENMTAIARTLGVEPRKLLSHVLDYRFTL